MTFKGNSDVSRFNKIAYRAFIDVFSNRNLYKDIKFCGLNVCSMSFKAIQGRERKRANTLIQRFK